MWAPWVVIVMFVVILAFTHWFLRRRAAAGRAGPDLRRDADAALHAPADGHGHGARAAEPAAGHPGADDLHGRHQAGPPAGADLGPDDRLHGDRDGPGPALRRGSAWSTSSRNIGGTIDARSRPQAEEVRQTDPDRATVPRRPGRAAPDPDVGPGAGQGVADVHRLAGDAADQGDRRRPGAGVPEPHRGGDARRGDLALRRRPRPVRPQVAARPPDPGRPRCSGPGRSRRSRTTRWSSNTGSPRSSVARRSPTLKAADGARIAAEVDPSRRPRSAKLRDESQKLQAEVDELIAEAKAADGREGREEADRAPPRGRRAALAADPDRDDLHHLPDDQGPGRRPGLRRDRGREPPDQPCPSSATPSRSASTTPTSGSSPRRTWSARSGSLNVDDPLHEPDPVPRDGRERLLPPGRRRATSARTS